MVRRLTATDSVRQTAIYSIAMLLTGSLLTSCLSAPLHSSDAMDPWWYNSCDHNTRHVSVKKLRVSNCSGADEEVPKLVKTIVRREWKNLNSYFQKEYDNIRKMYKPLLNFKSSEQKDFKWLRTKFNVKKFIAENRTKEVLPYLHEDLQKYAVAINYLAKLDIQTEANFNWPKRNRILHNLSRQLKSALCETETAVNATCQAVPERIPITFPEENKLSTNFDLTGMIIQDWSVLSKLKTFIGSWNQNIRKLFSQRSQIETDDIETDENFSYTTESFYYSDDPSY